MKSSKKEKYSNIFLFISVIFISCLLISNILTSKLINVFGITMTAGVLVFPITYIIGDILTEIYGYSNSKKVIIYGFICNLLMAIIFFIAIKLPYPDYWNNQEAFSTILGNTPRVLCASFIGYLIGGFTNSYIMDYIKHNSKIKYLWFRTVSSTFVGEILDTSIFLIISFIGTLSMQELLMMIFYQTLVKVLYEILLTPFTYKIIKYIKVKEKVIG